MDDIGLFLDLLEEELLLFVGEGGLWAFGGLLGDVGVGWEVGVASVIASVSVSVIVIVGVIVPIVVATDIVIDVVITAIIITITTTCTPIIITTLHHRHFHNRP